MKKLFSIILAFVMVFSLCSVTAFAEEYTNNGGTVRYGISNYDIQFRTDTISDTWHSTTYGNSGWALKQEPNDSSMVITKSARFDGPDKVYLDYTVTAGESGLENGKLAVCADVQCGNGYRENVSVIKNVAGNTQAITVSDQSNTLGYYIYFAGTGFEEPASTYWFGHYGQVSSNYYNQTNLESIENTDCALVFSWQNINLGADESITYSLCFTTDMIFEYNTSDANTVFSYKVDPTYTVTIPAEVTLGETATVSAENVILQKGKEVNVSVASDFTVKNANGTALTYKMQKNNANGDEISTGQTILIVNPDTASTGYQKIYFSLPNEKIKHPGEYKGKVTFNVAIKEVQQ